MGYGFFTGLLIFDSTVSLGRKYALLVSTPSSLLERDDFLLNGIFTSKYIRNCLILEL